MKRILIIVLGSPIWGSLLGKTLNTPSMFPFPQDVVDDTDPLLGLYGERSYENSHPFFASQKIPEGKYLIVVEKIYGKLNVFQRKNSSYQMIHQFSVSTGKDLRAKQQAGDHRTPEGVYLSSHYRTKLPNKLYGRFAYVLNYPNPFDQFQSRGGHGIWIHATDKVDQIQSFPFDSQGCIVLRPNDFQKLVGNIGLYETPIVIVSSVDRYQLPAFSPNDVEVFLENWRQAWEDRDLETYQEFYDLKFQAPSKFKTLTDYFAHKKNIFAWRKAGHQIDISQINIASFSDHLLVTFFQSYESGMVSDQGKKSLYLKYNQKRKQPFSILSENWHKLTLQEKKATLLASRNQNLYGP
jgi:murein L,D-transpeptidase YafK